MSVVDKMILLSHTKFHEDNLRFIVNTFLENDYPVKFIFDTINFRLRFLLKRKLLRQADPDIINNEKKTTWFTILSIFLWQFKNITKKLKC